MKSTDLCLSSGGAEVVLATSSDEKYPPENIIDGSSETFWTTTGMFPQEFIISFHKCVKISKLTIQCYLVRSLRIEKSLSKDPVDFEQLWLGGNYVATYLRFIIKSAFDHFVSVHTVMAEGVAENI
uniref:Intraflagellar transport protein 25 homolog n=1 Tax=Chelydra serpentina TaxID=8475 RepID=A0A8C3RL24_CHESE